MKATLILANGSIFSGTSIGSTETRLCELVLNTSMAGYQEILTDPACAGQGGGGGGGRRGGGGAAGAPRPPPPPRPGPRPRAARPPPPPPPPPHFL